MGDELYMGFVQFLEQDTPNVVQKDVEDYISNFLWEENQETGAWDYTKPEKKKSKRSPIRQCIENILGKWDLFVYTDATVTNVSSRKPESVHYRMKFVTVTHLTEGQKTMIELLPHVIKVGYYPGKGHFPGIVIYFDCKPKLIKL